MGTRNGGKPAVFARLAALPVSTLPTTIAKV
jgi:hypothetical protein